MIKNKIVQDCISFFNTKHNYKSFQLTYFFETVYFLTLKCQKNVFLFKNTKHNYKSDPLTDFLKNIYFQTQNFVKIYIYLRISGRIK